MLNNHTIQYPFSTSDLQMQVEYSGNLPVYIGYARPDAATSAAEWQIKKVTYDSNNNVTAIQFAAGVNDFNKVWDNRATYSYS